MVQRYNLFRNEKNWMFSLNFEYIIFKHMKLKQTIYLILFGLVYNYSLFAQIDNKPTTKLIIVQGLDSLQIDDTIKSIYLKAESFKLVFHTFNSTSVLFHCSYDSTSYRQVISGKASELTCFDSYKTFIEPSKNADKDIIAVRDVDRGYHCLFGVAEDEFIRFDNVDYINKNEWIGTRTVEKIYDIEKEGDKPVNELSGEIFYFLFSPGIEKEGKPLKVYFK